MGVTTVDRYRDPVAAQLVTWWRRRPLAVQDVATAALLVVVWLVVTSYLQKGLWIPRNGEAHVVAMWATGAAVALRRILHPAVLLVGLVAYPLVYTWPMVTEFHLLPVLIVAYCAAKSGRVRPVVVGLVCLGITGSLLGVLPSRAGRAGLGQIWWVISASPGFREHGPGGPILDWSRITFALFVVAGTTFLGALVLAQHRTAAALAARNAELERLRQVESRQVVVEERSRIARELHDVVAHHMSAIVIRAQAAERLGPKQPEVAVEASGWIAQAGQEALAAMRHTVQVLRTGDVDRQVELAPQPTLGDIRHIAERLAPTGLAIEVDLPRPLPVLDPQVDLAAVRIAQEALTNALRHAQAGRAVVSVSETGDGLLVVVDDDGRTGAAPPAHPQGHGLRGMAERAASCGGRLTIVPSPLGGWRVMAQLPHPIGPKHSVTAPAPASAPAPPPPTHRPAAAPLPSPARAAPPVRTPGPVPVPDASGSDPTGRPRTPAPAPTSGPAPGPTTASASGRRPEAPGRSPVGPVREAPA
jgi:signal transduction histidine kinase